GKRCNGGSGDDRVRLLSVLRQRGVFRWFFGPICRLAIFGRWHVRGKGANPARFSSAGKGRARDGAIGRTRSRASETSPESFHGTTPKRHRRWCQSLIDNLSLSFAGAFRAVYRHRLRPPAGGPLGSRLNRPARVPRNLAPPFPETL